MEDTTQSNQDQTAKVNASKSNHTNVVKFIIKSNHQISV